MTMDNDPKTLLARGHLDHSREAYLEKVALRTNEITAKLGRRSVNGQNNSRSRKEADEIASRRSDEAYSRNLAIAQNG